jgi:hypothetical protein
MAEGHELLAELRRQDLLRPARELGRPPERLPSGLAALDRLCGGLPRARISEVIVGPCGGAGVLSAVLAGAAARGAPAALVDPADGFDPVSAQAAGVALERLLWVRPPDERTALRAGELILDAGGFEVLALSLNAPEPAPRRGGPAAWARLDRLARRTGALVLVLARRRTVGPFAALVATVARCRARWRPTGAPAAPGRPWLAGVELEFELARRRGA